jgi:hypothetical protein
LKPIDRCRDCSKPNQRPIGLKDVLLAMVATLRTLKRVQRETIYERSMAEANDDINSTESTLPGAMPWIWRTASELRLGTSAKILTVLGAYVRSQPTQCTQRKSRLRRYIWSLRTRKHFPDVIRRSGKLALGMDSDSQTSIQTGGL